MDSIGRGNASRRSPRSVAILATLLAAPAVRAEGPAGGILGWVEDARGAPVRAP